MRHQADSTPIDRDDEPVDPNADEYSDEDEGADSDGTPITSVNGSEELIWKDES